MKTYKISVRNQNTTYFKRSIVANRRKKKKNELQECSQLSHQQLRRLVQRRRNSLAAELERPSERLADSAANDDDTARHQT